MMCDLMLELLQETDFNHPDLVSIMVRDTITSLENALVRILCSSTRGCWTGPVDLDRAVYLHGVCSMFGAAGFLGQQCCFSAPEHPAVPWRLLGRSNGRRHILEGTLQSACACLTLRTDTCPVTTP